MKRRSSWQLGRRRGFTAGYRDGLHAGRCEAVRQRTLPVRGPVRDMHVMLVPTGLWAYRPIDEGVAAALGSLVSRLTVVPAGDDPPAQAAAVRPDLLLVMNPVETLRADQIATVRAHGIRTAVWFTDDPYYSDVSLGLAPHFDHVFTLDAGSVSAYAELGCNAHHLPLGVNSELYRPKPAPVSQRYDVVFIGSAFHNRVRFFDELAGWLAGKHVLISGYWWERMANFAALQGKIRSGYWISPEDTATYYSGAKIVINLHRGDDETNRNSRGLPALSTNPRTFEISACGSLQLTDVREDLGSCYEPGVELAVFQSPAELIERAEYYLAREEERERMALLGLRRTLRDHTYVSRIERLLTLLGV